MARGKGKTDHRADTKGAGFTGLPHVVQDSAAYRHLSLWARAVLSEIIREFNGYNNGEIVLSVTQMCERLGNSNRGKAARAIAELMEHGLVDVAADAKWKQRLAREFRLTFITSGKFPHIRQATNEYAKWHPAKKSSGNDALPERPRAGNASLPEAPSAGDASLPVKKSYRRKTALSGLSADAVAGNAVSPLIGKPYHSPERGVANAAQAPEIGPPKIGGPPNASGGTAVRPETLAMLDRWKGREAAA
jgi:hypothetical protein